MNTILKRVISMVLCFVLMASYLPAGAFAAETGETVTPEITEVTETLAQTASETEELFESTETSEEESEQTDVSGKNEKEAEKAEKKDEKEAKKEEKETETSTEPSSEATEPSSEATEPSSEATEPSSEATESSSEPTEPVVIPVTGITLDQTALEVGVGELPMTLTATVLPEDATDKTVIWASSEPGVVSVEDGVLTFGYMGTAVITATAGGFSASCTVKVGEGEWDTYEGGTVVIAGSDFQAASHTAGAEIVSGLLDQIDNDYPVAAGFLFAGDYDVNYSDSANGQKKLQETVQTVYGTEMDEIYVQGNHDADNLVGSNCTSSGAHDSSDYGVFVINEKDYMWYNNDEATIKKTAENLKSYLDAKRNADYTKPIFVVSHLPLHYSMRTRSGGNDGMHANYIFDVLNEAGEAGLNIIFLFGHNHSHGWDDYLGGAAIFLTEGNKINIAQNSTTVFQEETLAFTYMNAGYVGYYGTSYTSDVDKTLTMTAFEITDTNVIISRYDSAGTHNLKSAGVYNVEYPDSAYYSTDPSLVGTPYTMTLNTEITPAGEEIEAPDSGNTGSGTAGSIEQVTALEQGVPYIIVCDRNGLVLTNKTTTNKDGNDSLLLEGKPSADTTHLWYYNGTNLIYGDPNSTNSYLLMSTDTAYLGESHSYRMVDNVYLNNDGTTFTLKRNDDNLYLNQYGGSSYTAASPYTSDGNNDAGSKWRIYKVVQGAGGSVDASGGDWVTITAPTAGGTRYQYELDTNGIDTGVEYLIVANSYPKALSAAASSNNAVDITIDGNYAYADSDTYGWTFTRYDNDNSVYYIRLNNSSYLTLPNNSIGSSNSSGKSCRWTVTNNNNGSYDIVRNNYNLRWSNSNSVFQVSSSNEGPVRLYKYVKTETTDAKAGLYGKISGDLTYNVEIGTSRNDALAAVKAGIDILYHQGDANTAQTFPDDGEGMTWTLDPSYDGVTPGEYAVTIAYSGVTLGVAKVVVPTVAVKSYEIAPMSATVRQGAAQSLVTKSKITVTLENGDYYTVPVTISMLSKNEKSVSTANAGTQTGLTVTYNGVEITNDFTLNVVAKAINNYPEYPDEGAVKVNKTATGIDFQSSGIAQVEVSASGVPVKKGADVVVVIDTSSSMRDNNVGGTDKSRIEVLSESLNQMLTQFQTPGDDGTAPDISIAIIDFNGYYASEADDFDKISLTNTYRTNVDYARVFTGTDAGSFIKNVGVSAGNFVDASSLTPATIAAQFTKDNCKSGTNYDGALENAYNLLAAKQVANGDEDRDSYVIFLSDGAPFRYNGFNNGSDKDTYDTWNRWLNGTWSESHNYGYFANIENGKHYHRYAEAIKGTKGETYQVIARDAAENTPEYMKTVNGLGATIYGIGFGLADDGNVSVNTQSELIQVISSGDGYNYPNVQDADALTDAFTQIVSAINYAASGARFVDQMGSNFNLQMGQLKDLNDDVLTDANGQEIENKIEIISYDIWTRQDYLDNKCTEDQIGDRKGTYSVLETVTFSEDGNQVFSDQINNGTTNILADGTQAGYVKGVIYAKTFLYNTNTTEVAVDGVNIPTGKNSADLTTGSTNVLPKETFYWKMGTVQTSELAMRYYVYLDGSMEGTREAGSYPTNNFATLYYDNYLGNPCLKDTVSPVMAWKSANVSYAFYLVNENGEIIVNQTTGQTGTFANKIAVTNPVVYEEILLNNTDQVRALDVRAISDDVLPKYYQLYDESAVYAVTIKSDSTGYWEITKGNVTADSTYVTNFGTSEQYSNAATMNAAGVDYTHTVVWFAVVWNVGAHPDSVVVDYGLPVDISVLGNDMFGENGRLAGVGAYSEGIENTTAGASLENGFGADYTGTYGTAKADTSTDKVRYTLNSMQMPTYEKFAYAVNYTGSENAGYYYDTVTVIPATTIYYEDSFVRFNDLTWQQKEGGNAWEGSWTVQNTSNRWTQVGNTVEGVQDEDRPGKYSLTDANNIYGYDNVNKSMSTYSMGSAMKATVDYDNGAQASFNFMGTGFDVISMTDSTTGTIWVKVYPYNEDGTLGEIAKNFVVDTYYGYNHGLYNVTYTYTNGEWIKTIGTEVTTESATAIAATFPENPVENATVTAIEDLWVLDPNAAEHIWQVPVMKIDGLTYGKYKGVIEAVYEPAFDHVDGSTSGSYDFYLDAIRIYDPANDGAQDNDTVIEDAYKADGEGWPSYVELRNGLISEGTLGNAATDKEIEGLVFIDGDETVGDAQISDYISYGPNNEVYLAPGQRVAFRLSLPENAANVHIGIKSADGNIGTYSITNIAQEADTENNVAAGQWYNAKTATMDTATDMYYDLTEWKNDIIVISNTGNREDRNTSGIISLTNIKFTYTSDPGDEEAGIYVTPKMAMLTLRSLNAPAEEESPEETAPDESVPEETVPETTVPETTEPEETEPEETEPEETQPDKESEKIQKEIEKALKKAAKELQKAAEKAAKALSKLFGNWF